MVILENIDIDKAILQNIDIDKISNQFKFGISNRAKDDTFVIPHEVSDSLWYYVTIEKQLVLTSSSTLLAM